MRKEGTVEGGGKRKGTGMKGIKEDRWWREKRREKRRVEEGIMQEKIRKVGEEG
jgi:hypothetical protein